MQDTVIIETPNIDVITINETEVLTLTQKEIQVITLGKQGPEGASTYQIAVANGFVGTEAEWLASLAGTFNGTMDDIADGSTYVKTENNLTDTLAAMIHAPGSDNETASSIATIIDGTTAKTPLVDTDTFPLTEPTTLKKTLWSTIKSTLKTYFDGLYLSLTGGTITGGLTVTPTADAVNQSKFTDKDGNVILSIDTVNNRVGVGTSAPQVTFEVVNPTGLTNFKTNAGAAGLYFVADNAGTKRYGEFSLDTSANLIFRNAALNPSGSIYFDSKQDIIFRHGSYVEKFRFTSVGRLGILTSAPDKQLEINSVDGNNLRLTYNDNNGSAANYVDFLVSSDGKLTINASGGIINTANDIEITDATKGIILKSPNGTRFRVTVGDVGALITTGI